MDAKKQQKLEAKGWKVTTVEDFLGLMPADVAAIEARLMQETQDNPALIPEKSSSREEAVSAEKERVQELVKA